MKKGIISLLAILGLVSTSFAATTTTKQIDNIQNSTGGASIAVPGTGTTLVTDTSTVTLTNKTISGLALSGTITGTPTFSGAVSFTGGPSIAGSGTITTAMHIVDPTDTTKQLAFSLSGMTTAKTLTLSTSQTTTQTLSLPNVGSGDSIATLNATQTFGSGSTWNGVAVGAAYGGTGLTTLTAHDVLVGNGTGNVTLISPSTSGFVLTSNGTGADPSFQAASSPGPTLTGTQAAPFNVTAAGGVVLTTPTYLNLAFIQSNTAGNVVVTATPSVTACTAAGQVLSILGEDATKTVTLQDEAGLSGSKLHLNGNWTSSLNSMLTLECDGNGYWIERSRAF